jgi:hypothetical protein
MIPWPLALLTLFYGALAAFCGATLWKISTGVIERSAFWPLAWLALSGAVVCGLPLLKPWSRTLAIAGSIGLGIVTIGFALIIAGSGHPGLGMAGALLSGMHLVVIRYLRRPAVKVYFSG